jgi:RHS repeat-associated protein
MTGAKMQPISHEGEWSPTPRNIEGRLSVGAYWRVTLLWALPFALVLVILAPAGASAAECTDTWTGPAEGNWATASNWSAGHVPNEGDVACIGSGKTAEVISGTNQTGLVQGEGTLAVMGGNLQLQRPPSEGESTISGLKLGGWGTLKGVGSLSVAKTFSWTGGWMEGTGTTVISSAITASIYNAGLSGRTLINKGTLTLSSGWLSLNNGARFENSGTFTVNVEGGEYGILHNSGVASLLVNTGTIRKTSGSGSTNIKVGLENLGWLVAETGSFAFPSTEPMTFGAESILAGDIRLAGPAVTARSFGMGSGTLTLQSGSLSMESGYTATVANLTETGGAIKGAGALRLGTLTWTGGSMTESGSTTVLAGGTATVSNATLAERTLVNEGSLSLNTGYFLMRNSAILENAGTLTVNAEGKETGIIHLYAEPAALLINAGTLRKTSGKGSTVLEANLVNEGTVKAETGTLAFSGNETVLLFNGSSLIGGISFATADVFAGDVTSNGGTLTFNAIGSTVEIATGATLQASDLALNAPLEGAGKLEITHSLTWGSVPMSGGGKTVLAPGASGSVVEGKLDDRTFVNEGTMTLSSRYLQLRDGSVFENQGTFNANAEGYELGIIVVGSPNALFLNTGVFQKTAGTGTTEVEPPFNNNGVIREQSGHLDIKNPVKTKPSEVFGKRSCSGDPVECATGNFTESQTDLAIGGRGVGLSLTRAYSAKAAATATSAGPFGYGWTATFSDHLAVAEAGVNVTVVRGDGTTIPFTRTTGTSYAAPAWAKETLSGSPEAGYTFTSAAQTQYRFSGGGRLETVADRNGNETALAYDEAGRLKSVTDPAGRQLSFAYNAGGQVEGATDPMGHVVKYAYEAGKLTAVTLPGEESPRWQFKYDASHRITQVTDGRGGKTSNEYDGSSRVVSQTDPAERTLTFKYEPFHTTVTNKATGAVTDKWFTSSNEPFSITYGYGTPQATTRSFAYDGAGHLVREADGNGHSTTFGYDEAGNRTSEKDALGHETKWTYNSTHDVISTTTPGGETTTIERDSHGNVEAISRPGPGGTTQTTSFAYDEHGQLENVTDPLERTWSFGYDSYGDRTSETDPIGHTQTLGYDKDSRLVSSVSPRGNAEGVEPAEYETTIERDPQGRPLKATDPLGHSTEYAYDGNGNLASLTDADGHTTKYTYNADDEQTKVEKPNAATLETGYDGAGEITSQTDANEHATTYVRNVLEQPVEVIDPLGRRTIKGFDAAGNLTSVVDAAERETSYSYDAADRLTAIDHSEEATADASYEYDADGHLTAMTDGTGESSFAYDQLGRLTESENGHGEAIEYSYDLAEELTGTVYPNGKEVSRSYDGAGRLESVGDWLGGKTSFGYDADSNLTAITFPTASGNTDEYSYDRASRMSEAKFKQGSETLASLSYVRDPLGQVETETRNGLPGPEELTYGYDENDRLIEADSEGFEYDAADNLTNGIGSTNSYDAASQLETGTSLIYTYDKLGERTKATPSSGPATSYGYDQAGDLTSISRPEEGEVAGISEALSYDGTGLLASKTTGLTTRHLAWDLTSSLPLLLDDGENSYVYGPGGLPVEQVSAKEEPTYLHHDQLGSTRMLTGESGEGTATLSYAPYGRLEGSTGTQNTSLAFASQYTDAESGLQYLRARFYDPGTGQFLTRDPIEELTRQPYSYALQNPLNFTDPGGLSPGELIGGGCAAGEVVDPVGGCVPGSLAGAAAEVGKYAGPVVVGGLISLLGGGEESSSDENDSEPCRGTQIGHGAYELTKAAQWSQQYINAFGGGPPSGPRGRALLAIILLLLNAARR